MTRGHRDDMRVLKSRREHDFALEPIDRNRGRELVRKHLDDDASTEGVVARDVHRRHASATELPLEGVGLA